MFSENVGGISKRRHHRNKGLWVGRLWNDYGKWGNVGIFVNEYGRFAGRSLVHWIPPTGPTSDFLIKQIIQWT
jgi:hypothetical protein